MIESYKATQFWVDMYDKRHTLFNFKYINNSLQIIKRTFYLLQTFRTNMRLNYGGFAAAISQ